MLIDVRQLVSGPVRRASPDAPFRKDVADASCSEDGALAGAPGVFSVRHCRLELQRIVCRACDDGLITCNAWAGSTTQSSVRSAQSAEQQLHRVLHNAHRDRLGHRVLATFLRAVAEAVINAYARRMRREIYLTLLSMATCIRQSVSDYTTVSCLSNLSHVKDPRSFHRFLADRGILSALLALVWGFWPCHTSRAPELGEIIK